MPGLTLISDLVSAGKEFGVFEFYLPFVIIFAIFWAILTKVKLFGDPFDTDKKKARMAKGINLIISLGASLYIMANTTLGFSFAMFLSGLFGGAFTVIMTIIAFTSVLFVAYAISTGKDPFAGKTLEKGWKYLAAFVVLAAIIFALAVYMSSAGTVIFPGLNIPGLELPSFPTIVAPSIGLTTSDLAIIFLVVITGLIIFYVTWGGRGDKSSTSGTS